MGRYDKHFSDRSQGCGARAVAGPRAARLGCRQDISRRGLPLRRHAGAALAARGPDDIVTRLKLGLEPLADYQNHDGLLLSNGSDVMYEHSETWTFSTGERGLLRFVSVHKVVDGRITVWKDYWDFNSLVSFAPPNHFENLANADTSWVFDATALV